MYEEEIVRLLFQVQKPVSINEVREALSRKLGRDLPYETVKRDLISLAARGAICSKSVGKSKRATWIFWPSATRVGEGEAVDPFEVPIEERDSMTAEELVELYDLLESKYGELIRGPLGKSSRCVVLCDRKVVFSSSREPTNEEVENIERKYGKVCYIVARDLIEEGAWCALGDDDYYPTIKLFIGEADWMDGKVFRAGVKLTADFDTGNPDVLALSHSAAEKLKFKPKFLRRAYHLGIGYDYYILKAKVGIRDEKGKARCMVKMCRSILSWENPEKNPFLLTNPKRSGFVGRDIMLSFPLLILLNGEEKRTKWKLIA